jgi:hypothetical protein
VTVCPRVNEKLFETLKSGVTVVAEVKAVTTPRWAEVKVWTTERPASVVVALGKETVWSAVGSTTVKVVS